MADNIIDDPEQYAVLRTGLASMMEWEEQQIVARWEVWEDRPSVGARIERIS